MLCDVAICRNILTLVFFCNYFEDSAWKFPFFLFFMSLKFKIFYKNSSKILFSVILEIRRNNFAFFIHASVCKILFTTLFTQLKIQRKVLSTQGFVCDVTWEIRSFLSQVRILFSQSSRKWIQTLFSRKIGLDSVSFIAQNFRIHLEA